MPTQVGLPIKMVADFSHLGAWRMVGHTTNDHSVLEWKEKHDAIIILLHGSSSLMGMMDLVVPITIIPVITIPIITIIVEIHIALFIASSACAFRGFDVNFCASAAIGTRVADTVDILPVN